jgi:hypothetical protein
MSARRGGGRRVMIEQGTVLGLMAAVLAGCSMLPGKAQLVRWGPDRAVMGPQIAAQGDVASLVIPPTAADEVEERLQRLERDLARVRTEFQDVRPGVDRLIQIEGDIRVLLAELSSLSDTHPPAPVAERSAPVSPVRTPAPIPAPSPIPVMLTVAPGSGGSLPVMALSAMTGQTHAQEARPAQPPVQPQPTTVSASILSPPSPLTTSQQQSQLATRLSSSSVPVRKASQKAETTKVVEIVPW